MRAVIITQPGGPEVLEVRAVPDPQPGAREVLVQVRATALNRADLLQRRGLYPPPPGAPADIPGIEFAGEVVALGAAARRWRPGQRVFGITGGGTHAELVTVHEDAVSEAPVSLAWPSAGGAPEVFITAQDALRQAGFIAGETVLIHAAGSGVGLAGAQLVAALGGQAFGTTRTAAKLERARPFGLLEGFVVPETAALSGLADFAARVTGGRGFDIVLDLNGGPYFPASLAALAPHGRLMVIGSTAGVQAQVDLRPIFRKRLRIIGTVLRARTLAEKIAVTQAFAQDIVPLLASGKVRTVIDSEFPLAEIRAAHERLESDQTFGKVIVTIGVTA